MLYFRQPSMRYADKCIFITNQVDSLYTSQTTLHVIVLSIWQFHPTFIS